MRRLLLAVCVLLLCSACGQTNSSGATTGASPIAAAALPPDAPAPTTAAPTPMATVPVDLGTAPGDFSTAVRRVVQNVRPAVVQITNQQVDSDPFSDQATTEPVGVGSGVIYDAQGHILTNNHVVEGADELIVSLPDGRVFPAKLLGADPNTDLAVVQISGNNLPFAAFGDARALAVGDWVVAIGNALALPGGPTVSAGVVSALGRTVQEPGETPKQPGPYLFDVIQTDAPINPGNSGGPLLNLQGQVIGINTLAATQAEPGVAAQGIGFAISITTAKPIADQLAATGRAIHPYIGVSLTDLTPAIARRLNVSAKNGVVVRSVTRGSPADTAGLQPRDVITAIDGTTVVDQSTFARLIDSHHPGDTVVMTTLRGGQTLQTQVTLAVSPPSS